jgi:uncharacterized protein with von Willebrand factor type A (vWA) domain
MLTCKENPPPMFLNFFTALRDAQVPVTLREYLTLMEALEKHVADQSVEDFYYLSRACLVKDERNLDKFDRVFGATFKGIESLLEAVEKGEIPAEWLKKLAEKYLTDEEKAQLEAMGWEKLMETLRERLKEQKGRHQGGNKWIGTAGTSPFGAYGYNPEGIRIGQDGNRNFRAVKVWDKREFKDLDGTVGAWHAQHQGRAAPPAQIRAHRRAGRARSRYAPSARRRTRAISTSRCARSGATPSRCCCSSTSAARWTGISRWSRSCSRPRKTEFKHMEHFYFHNCLYEGVWKENKRRFSERTPTWDVLHTYPHDYKVIFVGDASMSPYEIMPCPAARSNI